MNAISLRRLALAPALLIPTLAAIAQSAPANPQTAAPATPAPAARVKKAAPTPKPPVLGYVYPAGARIGESADITIGGGHLYGATAALVSGTGVTAEILDSRDPEEGLDETQRKRKQRKAGQTLLDETVTVRLTVAPDAAPGERQLCLLAPGGISNRRIVHVGRLPEILEKETNNTAAKAQVLDELPVTINGRLLQSDEDSFVFRGKRGQTIVAEVAARALIPYIADAVPGWFQATVAVFDADGREIAYADDFRFNPDPVLTFTLPADGQYRLLVRDALSRGREDFVYRVRLGELPFITSLRPLGARRSAVPARAGLFGKNLPATALSLDTSRAGFDTTLPVRVERNGAESNRLPFAVDDLPEVAESALREPAPNHPPYVRPPCIVNGVIARPGEKDRFALYAKAGDTLEMEIVARRLGSPLDSRLTLLGPDGAALAMNDDHKDPAEGLLTHQADSLLTFTFPAEGTYTLVTEDTQGKGGDDFQYRLRLDSPHPDFALSATPAAVVVPRGGTTRVSVKLMRRNGFAGPVTLRAETPDAPGAPALAGGVIPADADKATLTLTLPADTRPGQRALRLVGRAECEPGRVTEHPVLLSEDAMQAFIYHHPVPCHDLLIAVPEKPAAFSVTPAPGAPGELARGRTTAIPLRIARDADHPGEIRLQVTEAPKGVGLHKGAVIPAGAESAEVVVRVAANAAPGNLLLNAVMEIPLPEEPAAAGDAKPAKPKKRRVVLPLPALRVPPAEPAAKP